MNKHILSYTTKLNESIGRGSVLLIKGKPMKEGRYLYVTTIVGYAEIKPGIKMVFLGDQLYRVVHKGGTKFSGKKVSYNGEAGLKGVFNMKNPGKPSLVLNHNKTPFHWLTLKHTDIGKALREIGPGLFGHELILEQSENKSYDWDETYSFIMKEFFKLGIGQESMIKVISVDRSEYDDAYNVIDEVELDDKYVDLEYNINYTVVSSVPSDKLPIEHVNNFMNLGMLGHDDDPFDFMDSEDKELMGISSNTGTDVSVEYYSYVELEHSHDPGDYDTPPYTETNIGENKTTINSKLSIYVDGANVKYSNDLASLFLQFDKHIANDMDVRQMGDFLSPTAKP